MIARAILCVVVACVFGGVSGIARADEMTVNARIQRGEGRYGELDFRGAATSCADAARDADATDEEQARAWRCVGLAWLALDQRSLAREALDHVFTLDPGYYVDDPGLSPRQRAFVAEVRKEHPPKPAVKVEPTVVVTPPPPPPHKRTPVYKRWYLWTPIVLVLAGAGVGVGLALGLHHDIAPGTLSPGVVHLGLHF